MLYRSAEGAVCAASARMTATVKAELPEGERIAALRAVSSEGFATPAQGALEVRAAVDIELTAERCSSAGAITSVTDAGEADTAGRPSVTVVRAAAGDTLWRWARNTTLDAGADCRGEFPGRRRAGGGERIADTCRQIAHFRENMHIALAQRPLWCLQCLGK